MTDENRGSDDVGAETADESAVFNVDELGELGEFAGLDDDDREALAETSQRLVETVSRALSPTPLDPGERLNRLVQGVAMPRALESTLALNSILSASVRPQPLESMDRLGKRFSEAVMPQAMNAKRFSSALAGVDTTRAMTNLLGSSALASHTSMLGKSALAEAIGRSTAERAAFSVTSGLAVSDSVTSMVNKLVADTGGWGLSARSDLAASQASKARGGLTDSVSRLDLTTTGPSLAALGLTAKGPSAAVLGLTATGGLGPRSSSIWGKLGDWRATVGGGAQDGEQRSQIGESACRRSRRYTDLRLGPVIRGNP